jgi:hypothetical protein
MKTDNYVTNETPKPSFLLLLILSLILGLFLFVGCKPTEKIVYVDRVNDRVVNRIDSVVVTNTDTVRLFERGDSVFSEVIKWRVKNKVEIKRDTVRIKEIVTITKEVHPAVKEKKGLSTFNKIGLTAIILLAVILFFKIKRIFAM